MRVRDWALALVLAATIWAVYSGAVWVAWRLGW